MSLSLWRVFFSFGAVLFAGAVVYLGAVLMRRGSICTPLSEAGAGCTQTLAIPRLSAPVLPELLCGVLLII